MHHGRAGVWKLLHCDSVLCHWDVLQSAEHRGHSANMWEMLICQHYGWSYSSRKFFCNTVLNFSFCLYSSSVPCPPTNATVVHTCAPDPVPVSWVASNSAKYYTAVAVSSTGHRSECTTNETSCSFSGLQCGEVYTIGVAGADDNCTGQQGDTVSLYTGNTTPITHMKVVLFI